MKRSGRKPGNIVPILCGEMNAEELPMALSRYNAILIDDPNLESKLLSYLPRN